MNIKFSFTFFVVSFLSNLQFFSAEGLVNGSSFSSAAPPQGAFVSWIKEGYKIFSNSNNTNKFGFQDELFEKGQT
ncbi:MAG: hypothetical protein ABJM36_06200 [Algibacter sp.]|uniref:hypothetical protein n=1 Tax=Algibacter sp. TaxID=1872428 RepID=UPI00329A4082